MAEIRHLRNAPIEEAVFDVKVETPADLDCSSFLQLKDELSDRFPMVKPRHAFQTSFSTDPSAPQNSEVLSSIDGYMFRSEDEKEILQYRLDGFTFNRLKPYTSWDALLPIAMEYLGTYVRAAAPTRIVRVAVRYINKFDVPIATDDYGTVLTSPPVIPEGMPNVVSEFTSRIVLIDTENRCAATLIKAIEPSMNTDSATIIVDIDAWKQVDLSLDQVEADFNILRDLKNRVFFNSLTESALEIFE